MTRRYIGRHTYDIGSEDDVRADFVVQEGLERCGSIRIQGVRPVQETVVDIRMRGGNICRRDIIVVRLQEDADA